MLMLSMQEFHPQWLKNPPFAGCPKISSCGAQSLITTPKSRVSTISSKPWGGSIFLASPPPLKVSALSASLNTQMNFCPLHPNPIAISRICSSLSTVVVPKDTCITELGACLSSYSMHTRKISVLGTKATSWTTDPISESWATTTRLDPEDRERTREATGPRSDKVVSNTGWRWEGNLCGELWLGAGERQGGVGKSWKRMLPGADGGRDVGAELGLVVVGGGADVVDGDAVGGDEVGELEELVEVALRRKRHHDHRH
ncbi:hypothetical protein NL676_016930 [Syzygium grande]|nr:hypothetical protein NL676_016930 [Syzygium grande]